MKLLVDTHTHTVISGHAYSTLTENAKEAYKKGLEGFVCADHGPAMVSGPPDFTVATLAGLPEIIEGVRVFAGAEANIMDQYGTLDMRDCYLRMTDYAIASLHEIIIAPAGRKHDTDAMISALNHPYVDVIGHPGNPSYDVDHKALVLEAKKLSKVIEINNHSFRYRKGSKGPCTNIMKLCMKHDVRITVSSDAHVCYNMGLFDSAIAVLEEIGFPEELIVSRNLDVFTSYLTERGKKEEF